MIKSVFSGVLGTRIESLELKIGSLQVHTGYLTFSLKKLIKFNKKESNEI